MRRKRGNEGQVNGNLSIKQDTVGRRHKGRPLRDTGGAGRRTGHLGMKRERGRQRQRAGHLRIQADTQGATSSSVTHWWTRSALFPSPLSLCTRTMESVEAVAKSETSQGHHATRFTSSACSKLSPPLLTHNTIRRERERERVRRQREPPQSTTGAVHPHCRRNPPRHMQSTMRAVPPRSALKHTT